MKLGIMQPYFFPYIGYFELIARTDRWVVFDIVQYNAKSWMSRNRILHPQRGWQYINVPVAKAPHRTAISQIRIKDRAAALQRVIGQLDHYRGQAPYFGRVRDLVQSAFAIGSDRLVDLNVAGMVAVCDYLGIGFRYSLCSQMGLDLSSVEHAGQWALEIARQLKASAYLNPPGGRDLFHPHEWEEAGIRLEFMSMPQYRYVCPPYEFVENLSILDVLMWNDPVKVAQALGKLS
jgi:hypothetical protein